MTAIPAADGFSGLAGAYREARPDYPEAMVRAVAGFAGRALAAPGALYVDVGAGTGISTAAILRGLPATVVAIGVEPNVDMRAEAQRAAADIAKGGAEGAPGTARLSFVDGRAERLPVPTGRAALVTAGQAAHWFDRPAFYGEAARVLAPGGALALFENIRDWRRSPFLDAHEAFLEAHARNREGRAYRRTDREQPYAQEIFVAFANVEARAFAWTRKMTGEAFVTMAKSSSQAQRALAALGEEAGLAAIAENVARHADADGKVAVPYTTHPISRGGNSPTANAGSGIRGRSPERASPSTPENPEAVFGRAGPVIPTTRFRLSEPGSWRRPDTARRCARASPANPGCPQSSRRAPTHQAGGMRGGNR